MGTNYGKMVAEVVKKYEKNKRNRVCEIRKASKKAGAGRHDASSKMGDAELKLLMADIREWRSVCKRINNISHLMGAELDERGFPCSVSIDPIFRPDTHQTYSSQVKFVLSRMQLDELSHFFKGEKRKHSRGPCRDEICEMALAHADSILFEENLKERKVIVTRCIVDESKVFTFAFNDLTDEKISAILERFIGKVFKSV